MTPNSSSRYRQEAGVYGAATLDGRAESGPGARVLRGTRAENPDTAGHRTDLGPPVVIVVDDSASARAVIRRLLESADFETELYSSGPEFLSHARLDRPGCLILDVNMPGMCGLEVQASLKQRGVQLPLIFLTGSSDIPIAVAAMREGALDFIEKPFDNDHLLARVRHAIDRDSHRCGDMNRREVLRRFALLTPRECCVLELAIAGRSVREIAASLGVNQDVIETNRSHLMKKLAASTLADLVRMSLLADGAIPE